MENLKELLTKKEILSIMIKEHLEEFSGMSEEEIKNSFIGDVLVDKKCVYIPFYEKEEITYSIYFKLISPKLNYYHEIIGVVEVREHEDTLKPGEIPACAGLSLILMTQAKEEHKNKEIAERCYGFYIYTNASKYLKGNVNRYNIHMKSENKDLLENNCCCGIEIYL